MADSNEYHDDRGRSTLVDIFYEQFPLLLNLLGQFKGDDLPECFPPYLGYILSCAMSGSPDPICFVVPDSSLIASISASLLALTEINNCFAEWVKKYASSIRPGQRVKVLPSGAVFEYLGIWPEFPDKFRLKVIDKSASRSFQINQVLRLEKTSEIAPKGKLGYEFDKEEISAPIDKLLGINSYGNRVVFECSILLLSTQKHFDEFAESLKVGLKDEMFSLVDCLPSGSVDIQSDNIAFGSAPMITITNRGTTLSSLAREFPAFTKTVIVDRATKLLANLQVFDDVADRQKLIVFADHNDFECLKILKDRGCVIWELSNSELSIGRSKYSYDCLGTQLIAATTESVERASAIDLQNTHLENASAILHQLDRRLETYDEFDALQPLLTQCYHAILEFGGKIDDSNDVQDLGIRVEKIESLINTVHAFLAEESRKHLSSFLNELRAELIRLRNAPSEKSKWLIEYFSKAPSFEKCSVYIRTSPGADGLRSWLKDRCPSLNVIQSKDLRMKDAEYGTLIIMGWPGRRIWNTLSALRSFKNLIFVGYSYEINWLNVFQQKQNGILNSCLLDDNSKKAQLKYNFRVDLPSGTDFPRLKIAIPSKRGPDRQSYFELLSQDRYEAPAFEVLARKDINVFTNTGEFRKARYVSFVGSSYAYITDTCRLPVIDESGSKSRVRLIAGRDLSVGDFVLFREHGDPDVLQSLAKIIAGKHEYERLRVLAGLWRPPLQKLRGSVRLIERWLREVGLNRTSQTIHLWLTDPDMIGPATEEDIEKIARMTKDKELENQVKAVASAIREVRALHVLAGKDLSEKIFAQLPSELESETSISLEFGEISVMEVESIEDPPGAYPAVQINRLRT